MSIEKGKQGALCADHNAATDASHSSTQTTQEPLPMSRRTVLSAAAAAALPASPAFAVTAASAGPSPTIVLVHGAFAGSEGWSDVTTILMGKGYRVVAAANPLRGVASDAREVAALLDSIEGQIVAVGHSYGGMVISNAAAGRKNVRALVYVGAFTPSEGESVIDLAGRYPGSTLGETLTPVALGNGQKDLYIAPDKYHKQFCGDIPAEQAAVLATNQRPIAEAAILEKSPRAAWKSIPSWHIYGTADKNIPAEAMKWMAQRAKAKQIVEIDGASHVPQLSHAPAVANIIQAAASSIKA